MDIINIALDIKNRVQKEISKNIIGYDSIVERIIVAILIDAHVLVEGLPGLAKTLLVKSISKALGLDFGRIQFTPDLMPSDITGSEIIYETDDGKRDFKFYKGAIFSNIILADEINRTPPRTQAALLEAMQEKTVTVNGKTYELPAPFTVLATQNPIDQEGTYPLPEAQQDRFLFYLKLTYPEFGDEIKIVERMSSESIDEINPVVDKKHLLFLRKEIFKIPIADEIIRSVVKLGRMTRPYDFSPEITKKWIDFGVSPRAITMLIMASKALSILRGKSAPTLKEVRDLCHDVFRHRIILNFQAEAEGIDTDYILDVLLSQI